MRQRADLMHVLESTVGHSPLVSGAAYFGSTARDTADDLSDIDLIVGCSPEVAGALVAQWHHHLGIALFRPFTDDRPPGGRYWFRDTNPFARLDVSFYGPEDFKAVVADGRGFAQPPFRFLPVGGQSPARPPEVSVPTGSPMDFAFAGALRRFHESAKAVVRGTTPKYPLARAEAEVLRFRGEAIGEGAWTLYAMSRTMLPNPLFTLADIAEDPALLTFTPELPQGMLGTLRPLEPADEGALGRFFSGLGAPTRRFYDVDEGWPELAAAHCSAIGRYDKLRLVLEVAGRISGVFEFSLDLVADDVERYRRAGVELEQGRDIRFGLCLEDDMQGLGVASALQPLMFGTARTLGASNVILWGGVLCDNTAAIRFYERHGFRRIGPFVATDGQDCLDMWAPLTRGD